MIGFTQNATWSSSTTSFCLALSAKKFAGSMCWPNLSTLYVAKVVLGALDLAHKYLCEQNSSHRVLSLLLFVVRERIGFDALKY